MTFQITSPAFQQGSMIPSQYTCDGEDLSPPLEWSNIPDKAVTLALIADDPDAPMGTWVHWVMFNIPSSTYSLPAGAGPDETLPDGSMQGMTNFKKIGYGGPCPPAGTHRYFFKLYALDTALNLKPGAIKKDVVKAMEGHILSEAHLMGKYKRR